MNFKASCGTSFQFFLALTIAVLFLCTIPVYAQVDTGSIVGTVTDPSGAVVSGAKVTMTNAGLRGQGITFDLPDIELRDLGKRQGGLTASQAASMVTNTLVAKIGQKVLTNIDLLRKGGVEGAIDALKGLIR